MYEDIFYLVSVSLQNLKLYALPGAELGIDIPEKTDSGKYRIITQTVQPGLQILLTGRLMLLSDGTKCFQAMTGNSYGYILEENAGYWSKTPTNTNTDKAQTYLEELITYNQHILENNLLCARAIELISDGGGLVSNDTRAKLHALQTRLSARNEALKQSGYITEIQEATSPEFSVYNNSLIKFMQTPGIGLVITTTVALIVIGVIIATTSALVYVLVKNQHTEAKKDVEYSDDLMTNLRKFLPPKVFDQLMKENAANAKQFNKATDAASGKSLLNTAKYLAVGFLGFSLIDKFLINRKNQ